MCHLIRYKEVVTPGYFLHDVSLNHVILQDSHAVINQNGRLGGLQWEEKLELRCVDNDTSQVPSLISGWKGRVWVLAVGHLNKHQYWFGLWIGTRAWYEEIKRDQLTASSWILANNVTISITPQQVTPLALLAVWNNAQQTLTSKLLLKSAGGLFMSTVVIFNDIVFNSASK